MKNWFKKNKMTIIFTLILLLCLVIGWILYASFGHPLIKAMYEGRSIGFLNSIIKKQATYPLEHYFMETDKLFFRFISGAFLVIFSLYLASVTGKRYIFFIGTALSLLFATYSAIHLNLVEDTYMMFRYAKNLANGHGLVWNIGKNPVEGATAFLWTILLSVCYKFGLPFNISVPLFNGLFLTLIIMLIYFSSVWLFKTDAIIGFIAICILATSPLVIQMKAGFETPMFSFFMTLLTISCAALVFCSKQIRKYCLHIIPLSGLLLGLTRPEGVIFSTLTFLSSFLILDKKERVHFIKLVILWFILPGAIYFIWRWYYFGYPFPNTFYAKNMIGKESLHVILREGRRNLRWLGAFLAPYIFVICFYILNIKDRLKWKILALLIPLIIFPFSYFMIFQVQNIGYRFQISILPSWLVLFSIGLYSLYKLPLITARIWKERISLYFNLGFIFAGLSLTLWLKKPILTLIILLITGVYILGVDFISVGFKVHQRKLLLTILLVIGFLLTVRSYKNTISIGGDLYYDDRAIIGKALKPFSEKDYTLLTSEAGYLPYYSQWITIDSFGLHDEYIAHNGLTMEYLDNIKPELILLYAFSSEWREDMGEWWLWKGKANLMIQKMYRYAKENNYILAAIVQKGRPDYFNWYYVKNDCPDRDGIIRAITNHSELVYSKKYTNEINR